MPGSPLSHLDLPDDDGVIELPAQVAGSQLITPVERLSPSVVNVFVRAELLARERGHIQVTSDDLFAALVTESQCAASRLLESLGFSGAELVQALAFILGRNSGAAPAERAEHSPRVIEIMKIAREEAGRRGAKCVETLHLLTALLRNRKGVAALLLETPGLGLEPVGAALNRALREAESDPA